MDIKEQISQITQKIKGDPTIADQFRANPVKTVEGILGIDLPDDVIGKVVDGVKANISLDKASDMLSSVKGIFGK